MRILIALLLVAMLIVTLAILPAHAQSDPCDACIADWSAAECPCLPVADEPPPISEQHWPSHWIYMPAIGMGIHGG